MNTAFSSIPLSRGKVALVDDVDLPKVLGYGWYANHSNDNRFYAVATKRIGGVPKTLRMHRVIMSCPPNMHVDHINGDTLDNRRSNLRICTVAENMRNRTKPKYVSLLPKSERWQVRVSAVFDTEKEAVAVYRRAIKALHGEFAHE